MGAEGRRALVTAPHSLPLQLTLPLDPRPCPLQVDPTLSRTVVVSTKLDTRIPQFARPSDVETYLRPPARLLEPTMLGGSPFFT